MRWLPLSIATCFALASAPAVAGNEVGINGHIPSAELAELIGDLGVHWVRVDNNWFQQGDPCSNDIQFLSVLDTAVTESVSRGVKVYMTVGYTPSCASLGDSDGSTLTDVPNPALYANYVRQAVAHYRAIGVTHFGLWNEANLDHFFEGTAADYVDNVVVPGIPAVADGCQDAGFSDCKVLGPDLAHVGDYDQFLEDVLNRMGAASASFDILTHHIYQDHDTQVFEGDSFVNALDMRRFAFTRRSLLDVLMDTGNAPNGNPVFDVWITETGYRAQPAMDAAQMAKQSDHFMRSIDEQLARDWYTNTIFYEIVDSGDEIDGFGIVRRDGNNFALKDAYLALQSRIQTDPGFQDPQNEDPDAGPGGGVADAGPQDPGAEQDAGGTDPNGSSGGGGCSTTGSSGPLWLVLLGLVMVAVRRTGSTSAL